MNKKGKGKDQRSGKDQRPGGGRPTRPGQGKFQGRGGYRPAPKKRPVKVPNENDPVRLNKFIANSGICSRREADVLITTGVITINDKIVTELGSKVFPGDIVKYDGQTISPEKKQYVLLNKPKNFITTMDDPMGRRTVMSLVKEASKERVFPVGRLDRMTTGLLLFTNDGELAKRLTHPGHSVSKLYHITLKEKVKRIHLDQVAKGIELDDGFIKADKIEYVGDGSNAHEVGIEIHSGRNRIVRRIFEHFGYTVQKLDRVTFAGLTKKDLPRGKWRHLSKDEIAFLYMNSGR